jgi:transcriptional regulator with XRE-family HTH domain
VSSKTLIKVVRQKVIDVPGFGKRLKEAREKSGKSAQVLATEANISTAYWYALEKADGDKDISVSEEILRNIERVINIDFGAKFDD